MPDVPMCRRLHLLCSSRGQQLQPPGSSPRIQPYQTWPCPTSAWLSTSTLLLVGQQKLQPSLPQPRGPGTVTRGLGQNHQYLGEKLLAGRGRQTILLVRSLVSQLSSSDHEIATKWAFFLREKNNDIKRAEDNYHYHLWDRSIHIEIAFQLHDVKMIQHGILQKVLISAD